MDLHISIHHCRSCRESIANLFATKRSRLLNLFQTHRLSCQLLTNRTAHKPLLMEDSDFSKVSRVVSDHDLLFDVACERGVHVAVSLKANTVLLDPTRFRER